MSPDPVSLVCLPFAGGGAGFFRAWRTAPSPAVEVVALQLPGREEQFHLDPFTDAADAVRALVPRAAGAARSGGRIALFGHSLGAVLAYEVAGRLEEEGHSGLCHLFVSGSPPPWVARRERITGLGDDAFLRRVEGFAGYRHEAFDDPELRELLLPQLRADVAMHEGYRPSREVPLTVPVTSLRGDRDTLVGREEARAWRAATTGPFGYTELPGGHMYLADSPVPVLRGVADACREGSTA
ncbi:thioesterase II family protein [Streptomyces sp. CRN 30]|uniref:thioesterase II family protein n=1 Tax=Streptomyces sp. CRN 30 TaxID=3075613 RepID=UPI002A8353D5|nr:alpha/beta fold hydrolase [Streptomyces sp. CRN 30]